MVMDLGFRSDPNLHRPRRGLFRVRIEARQAVGGARRLLESGIDVIDIWLVIGIWRKT
jgi:hypothetical protein